MAMNSEQRALKSETNGSQWRLDLCHSAQVQAIFEWPIRYLTSHSWRSTQVLKHYQQNTTYKITIALKIIIKGDIIHSNMI